MGLRFWGVALLAAVLALAGGRAVEAADGCTALRQACRAAGFSPRQGDVATVAHCVSALIDNRDGEEYSLRRLPAVRPAEIAACRVARAEPDRRMIARQTAASATPPMQPAPAVGAKRPNIIFILADDFSWNLMPERGGDVARSMPNLAALQADGVTFDNYFVTDSLCCPSRSSILTGLMPHNTGVFTNAPPSGGYSVFMARGNAAKSLGPAFAAGGYRTAMLGKYLNGYLPWHDGAGPGWSDWLVSDAGYREYSTLINHDGRLAIEDRYLTDVISDRAAALIDKAGGTPFLIYVASFAPHGPYVPPDRYKTLYPGLTYPRGPAYGARPDEAAPAWLKRIGPLPAQADRAIEAIYRDRVRSDKAIDDMIGALRRQLQAVGLAQSTYIVFSSDNGYHLGDYSLFAGKMTPFDTDIRVPLVIAGPGIPKGRRISQTAMNIDLFPTFAELAGLPVPAAVDGRSLVPLMKGAAAGPWRDMAVVEHEKTDRITAGPDNPDRGQGDPDSYVALRFPAALYVEYTKIGERSYYDLARDPAALHNIYDSLTAAQRGALAAAAAANHRCKGPGACWAAQQLAP